MIKPIADLPLTDSQVLTLVGEKTIESNSSFINLEQISDTVDIPEDVFYDAVTMLSRKRYITVEEPWTLGGGIVSLTVDGFKKYAHACLPRYNSIIESVVYQITQGTLDHKAIAAALQEKQILVDHVINVLDQKGVLEAISHVGGMSIGSVSPRLKDTPIKELLSWFKS